MAIKIWYRKQKLFLVHPVYCAKITRSWNSYFRHSSSWLTLNPIWEYFLPKSNLRPVLGLHWCSLDLQRCQNKLSTAYFLMKNQMNHPVNLLPPPFPDSFGPTEWGSASDLFCCVFCGFSFPLYLSNAQIKQHYCRKQNNNIKSQLRSHGGYNGPSFVAASPNQSYLSLHSQMRKTFQPSKCENAEYLFFCEWYFVAGADSVTVEGWEIDLVHTLGGAGAPSTDQHIWAPDNNRCGWRYLSELWSEWAVHNGNQGWHDP